MDKKLIRKMVQKCFLQYSSGEDLLALSEEDFEKIYSSIAEMETKEPKSEIYEIVNDVVYEYITN